MAQLVVRNIEEALVRALKLRAAARGISAEAEHRAILREALRARASLPGVGGDDDFKVERDMDRDDGLPG